MKTNKTLSAALSCAGITKKKKQSLEMDQVSTEILCGGSTGNAEPRKTFAEATERRQVNDKEDFQAIKAEFILPFTKQIFQNKEEQQKNFSKTVAIIRKKLPTEDRNNITVLNTIIGKKRWKEIACGSLDRTSKNAN